MALDSANYIDELSITDPTATDQVSEGDDQIRTVKRAVYNCFPAADIRVNAIHTSATAPTVSLAEGLVWIDTSAGAGNHVAKIYDGSSFIILPFSVETAQTVDINGGAIDGTVIGGATPAAVSGTTLDASTSIVLATGATVTGIDNATVGTGSATLLATQGAIKTYVDAQITAEDLDITTDSGTIDIDLDSDTLTVAGGSGLDTAASSTTVTVNVTDGGVTNAKLADMVANTVKVRNANSSGVPSDIALATTEVLIGDGTGFTAAALSGDATMTNAGAVTVAKLQGYEVSSTAPSDDYVLKYSTGTSKWEPAAFAYPDKLTTKGDLLAYNSVSSETRFAISGATNGDVLTADSTATNGFDWAPATVADNSITLAKLEDGTQGDILYYAASGAPTRLGFGTDGYFLKTQGTGANPIWAESVSTTINTNADNRVITGSGTADTLNGESGLTYNGSVLTVTGNILPEADGTRDLGASGTTWANVYSADLHLDNTKHNGNDIDGSVGSWTIQEGSDDLFLLNRKNGKKYKFTLQEV